MKEVEDLLTFEGRGISFKGSRSRRDTSDKGQDNGGLQVEKHGERVVGLILI